MWNYVVVVIGESGSKRFFWHYTLEDAKKEAEYQRRYRTTVKIYQLVEI